jgi:hypothetical protein
MIAGEEPELCYRLRCAGHQIVRLDREMTLHDAAMTRFGQWWHRNARAGHAYAECAYLHGIERERFRVRELLSILAWGAALPVLALAATPRTHGWSLVALVVSYALLAVRVYRSQRARGETGENARLYAVSCVVGKLAQLQGVARFLWNRFARRRRTPLIEYKAALVERRPSRRE